MNIYEKLFQLEDLEYKKFQCSLMPTVSPATVIGVRTPHLRVIAKELSENGTAEDFMKILPLKHYMEEDYKPEYMEMVCAVNSEEYYINMMIAWYFATALCKQYDDAMQVLKDHKLSPWVHNKFIQKASESRRITTEQKAFLKILRV